jgi:integrase
MPLFAVSKRLGHSDIQTTANIYGHLDRSTDIAAAASISRVRRPEVRPPLRAV